MSKHRVKFSEQVRRLLDGCGLSRYAISRETGIDQSTLSKFALGQRGLPMKTLDRLADFLDLNITPGPGYPSAAPGSPVRQKKAKGAGGKAGSTRTTRRKAGNRPRKAR